MAERLREAAAAEADSIGGASRRRGRKAAASTGEPAKVGRPAKPRPIAANVSDDTIKAAMVEIGAARTELESAQGTYRALLKKWEERGVPSEYVTWILKQKKRDVHEIERDIGWMNRLLAAASIPVGAQLGLFPDGESVGTKVDKAARTTTDDEIVKAKAEGYSAGERGIGEEANPYPDGSPCALAWAAERRRATVDRAKSVFAGQSGEDIAGETVEDMRALRSERATAAP